MNLFETVKENVSMRQAAEFCGIDINRSSMCCCPFHNDDSPSMKLYDDHYYCFGCGEHGDAIDLVSKLFSVSPKEAAERLVQELGISHDSSRGTEISTYKKESILRKIKAKQDKDLYQALMNGLKLTEDTLLLVSMMPCMLSGIALSADSMYILQCGMIITVLSLKTVFLFLM